ncbi:oxidoreductase [Thalassotalea euphylliae]|uniref:SDR family NAD(P)-dependent oxidoreductase n=1 Tax=Thalassotalea euphylliae TaxID=1655234 RepID=A0A3E0UJP9_9GAMM|nr:oxidoreductase [Thalassotalea euphylliae]REL35992.1 SDR family NAD(P)-dependent oxidoreductase [Thalassotalea euphylliae]
MNSQQVVLLTGASAGIGKETAKTLIKAGYKVYAVARRLDAMADLKALGGIPLSMDITQSEDIERVVNHIIKEEGKIDILINNAGYATQGPVEQVPVDEARRMFEVNLFGLGMLTQLVLPNMRTRKAGKIINISSGAGKVYFSMGAWYVASKHALEGWSDSLRVELKPFNIDVVIIEPGAISTEFNDVSLNPLVENYGDGPYRDMVNSLAEFSRDAEKDDKDSSPPSVITNLIVKAINAKRPKPRYAGGAMVKPVMFVRKWGGDRLYDWVITRMVK